MEQVHAQHLLRHALTLMIWLPFLVFGGPSLSAQPSNSVASTPLGVPDRLPCNDSCNTLRFALMKVRECSTVLPYVFFDSCSSVIRHNPGDDVFEASDLAPMDGKCSPQSSIDIIGARLRRIANWPVVLTGRSYNEFGLSRDSVLCLARCMAVRDILVKRWGIDPARIEMRTDPHWNHRVGDPGERQRRLATRSVMVNIEMPRSGRSEMSEADLARARSELFAPECFLVTQWVPQPVAFEIPDEDTGGTGDGLRITVRSDSLQWMEFIDSTSHPSTVAYSWRSNDGRLPTFGQSSFRIWWNRIRGIGSDGTIGADSTECCVVRMAWDSVVNSEITYYHIYPRSTLNGFTSIVGDIIEQLRMLSMRDNYRDVPVDMIVHARDANAGRAASFANSVARGAEIPLLRQGITSRPRLSTYVVGSWSPIVPPESPNALFLEYSIEVFIYYARSGSQ